MAPKAAIKIAPMHTRTVPISEYLVKDSPRIRVAKMVLKTSPDCHPSIQVNSRYWFTAEVGALTAWRVESTGSGRVVIWMVLPTMFEPTNMAIPTWNGQLARHHLEP